MQKSDAGDRKYSSAPTKSAGSPRRPSGTRASIASRTSAPGPSASYIHAVRFDLNTVGAIAFTVMPCGPHSHASARVRPSTAPFEAQ